MSTRPSRNITPVFPPGLAPGGKTGGTAASRSCGGCRRSTPYASAAMMRRIVLTTFPHLRDGLRASIPASHGSVISRRRLACRPAALRLPTLVRTPGDPPSERGSDPAAPLRQGEANRIRQHLPKNQPSVKAGQVQTSRALRVLQNQRSSRRGSEAVSAGSGAFSGNLRAAGSPRIDDLAFPRGRGRAERDRGAEELLATPR